MPVDVQDPLMLCLVAAFIAAWVVALVAAFLLLLDFCFDLFFRFRFFRWGPRTFRESIDTAPDVSRLHDWREYDTLHARFKLIGPQEIVFRSRGLRRDYTKGRIRWDHSSCCLEAWIPLQAVLFFGACVAGPAVMCLAVMATSGNVGHALLGFLPFLGFGTAMYWWMCNEKQHIRKLATEVRARIVEMATEDARP